MRDTADYLRFVRSQAKQFGNVLIYFFFQRKGLYFHKANNVMGPYLFLSSVVFFLIVFIKALWPDDPIKAFEIDPRLSPFKVIFDILPLPLVVAFIGWSIVVNVPVLLISLVFRGRPNISKIIEMNCYHYGVAGLLLAAVLLSIFLLGRHVAIAFIVLPASIFIAWRYLYYMGLAHHLDRPKLLMINVLWTVLFVAVTSFVEDAEITDTAEKVFNPFLLVGRYNVPSGSMEPTLPVGSIVLTNTTVYAKRNLRRGDVVVVKLPKDPDSAPYVKRVVAFAGETIQYKGGRLYINGLEQARTRGANYQMSWNGDKKQYPIFIERLFDSEKSYSILELLGDNAYYDNTEEYHVPPDHIFVLGDNRDNSTDSRVLSHVGFIPRANVIGKAFFRLYPSGAKL